MEKYLNVVTNDDCLNVLANLESSSVDLIIADPPYYKIVDLDWDQQFVSVPEYLDWCMDWTKECFRVLKPKGLIYVWGGVGKHKEHALFEYILRVEIETEFKFLNFITMRNFRVFGNARHFPFARQELVVFSKSNNWKHTKQYSNFEGTNRLGAEKLVTNVWVDCKEVALSNKITHKAEKPELACDRIILASSDPGDIIFIPFVGSGVECWSAKKLGRNFIGTEIDKDYCKVANKRIEQKII